jgi:hypothetical protein
MPEPTAKPTREGVLAALAARRRAAGRAVEQASGIPLALFGACDPMVEAKLLEDAMQLLRQMTVDTELMPTSPPPDVAANAVEPADIEALVRGLAGVAAEPEPDLLEGAAVERLWVLLDIAVAGTGVARQRATAQLREAMLDLRGGGVETPHLHELARLLECEGADDMSLLLRTLQLATRRALDDNAQQDDARAARGRS